jgi:hypothetical protein
MKNETIEVVVVRPGEEPKVETIPAELEGFQAAVGGGYVQCVPLDHLGVDLWCDEEGKLKGLPPNRHLAEISDTVCGTFFLSGGADEEGHTLGIPPERVAQVMEAFALGPQEAPRPEYDAGDRVVYKGQRLATVVYKRLGSPAWLKADAYSVRVDGTDNDRIVRPEDLAPAPKVVALNDAEQEGTRACPVCHGEGLPLGSLGRRTHYLCRDCGMGFSVDGGGN